MKAAADFFCSGFLYEIRTGSKKLRIEKIQNTYGIFLTALITTCSL